MLKTLIARRRIPFQHRTAGAQKLASVRRMGGGVLVKLLIADDDQTLCLLLATEMRAKGWKVDVAHDAMQTVMFAVRGQPDAILLDIQMPGGTGIEALKKLKASTKTASIPIVVLSGRMEPTIEADVLGLGAVRFVRKPVDVTALHTLLSELPRRNRPT